MNKKKLMELLKATAFAVGMGAAFAVAGLDNPEDHDDSEAWETPAYYEWLDKQNGNTNGVENVSSTPFW